MRVTGWRCQGPGEGGLREGGWGWEKKGPHPLGPRCAARCLLASVYGASAATAPAVLRPQRRREIFIGPLGAPGVSGFLTSLIFPPPHPQPCPLCPLHRKWAGPGVLVFAGPAARCYLGGRARAGPWGDGCGPSSRQKWREHTAAPCLSQVTPTACPVPLNPGPPSQRLPPARGAEMKVLGISISCGTDSRRFLPVRPPPSTHPQPHLSLLGLEQALLPRLLVPS